MTHSNPITSGTKFAKMFSQTQLIYNLLNANSYTGPISDKKDAPNGNDESYICSQCTQKTSDYLQATCRLSHCLVYKMSGKSLHSLCDRGKGGWKKCWYFRFKNCLNL